MTVRTRVKHEGTRTCERATSKACDMRVQPSSVDLRATCLDKEKLERLLAIARSISPATKSALSNEGGKNSSPVISLT